MNNNKELIKVVVLSKFSPESVTDGDNVEVY